MTTAFASWLAARNAGEAVLAPGVTTPCSFGDARREHLATRRTGGLFDFSFMSCAVIEGPGALACVNALQTRRLDTLRPGRIAYTLLLREDGSVQNDATVWRLDRERFWVFTGRRSDYADVVELGVRFDVAIADRGAIHAVIAVQGDISRRTIERCLPGVGLAALPYYGFQRAALADADCWIARLGYSGETGYEIVVADAAAPSLWGALLAAGADAGLVECGFDAADSLRIEAGHILFTRELVSPMLPIELGLGRLVDLDAREFRGGKALRERRAQPTRRRLAGLVPAGDAKPDVNVPHRIAHGTGVMTSGCWSPLLARRIGMGFVNGRGARPGDTVRLDDGVRARVARLPFYDPVKVLPRRAS